MTRVGLRLVAPGTSRFRNEDIAMAVPNILHKRNVASFNNFLNTGSV
jgi:hypothetical protein